MTKTGVMLQKDENQAKLLFVGTVHSGFTNMDELKEIIVEISPSLILVEIDKKDIKPGNLAEYPEEMTYTLDYANSHDIRCIGFDHNIDIYNENIDPITKQEAIESQVRVVEEHGWKELNRIEPLQELLIHANKLIDPDRWKERERQMKVNIENSLPEDGTVLIITGAAHIPFFMEEYPQATFPLGE